MFFNTAYSKVTEMKLFPAKFSKNDMDFFNPGMLRRSNKLDISTFH